MLASLDAGAAERPRRRVVLDRALAIGELARRRAAGARRRRRRSSSPARRAGGPRASRTSTSCSTVPQLLDRLDSLELFETAVADRREARARARSHTGIVVELRAVAPEQFGNLLAHLTGSAAHNAALRERAVRMGLHLSEYGVLDDATQTTRECATEAELYELVGLPYIEPELRENRGEIEAASAGTLPALVELADIRGDLHCHTVASDGRATIEEMALAARGARLRVPRDHRPLREPRLRRRRLARAAAPPDRARARG